MKVANRWQLWATSTPILNVFSLGLDMKTGTSGLSHNHWVSPLNVFFNTTLM